MKYKILILLLCFPLYMTAQNTWEMPEEEETEQKQNPDAKYLAGAVPTEDGHVVFRETIEAPNKSAADIYAIVLAYMQKMTREKNQLNSRVGVNDSIQHRIAGTYQEWLVFKSSGLVLDRTRLNYTMTAKCSDGQAEITLERISYIYEEARDQQIYKAENWITDEWALNKKQTKLRPLSGKFRRKTYDRAHFLFNKINQLLNK